MDYPNFIEPNIFNELYNFYNKFQNNEFHLKKIFSDNHNRAEQFSIEAHDLYLDYSKNWLDQHSLELLFKIADNNNLAGKIDALFSGQKINKTENRSALHMALRNLGHPSEILQISNTDVFDQIQTNQRNIQSICNKLFNKKLLGFSGKPINNIVNIGIGGSDLGPKMVYTALKPFWNSDVTCHFVANIDPYDISSVLEVSNPETTLFIVSSKSFSTIETLTNANTARDWLLKQCDFTQLQHHFVAVTSNVDKAIEFGINKNNILPMWDWVGGRYSLWSAIGISIALGTSYNTYLELLKGASDLDKHFKTKPWKENIPVILALLGIGYTNCANAFSHALLPYCQSLEHFTSYIQQLDMESNGKSVNNSYETISYQTGPIIWGSTGTNGQHAFHQLLHQGTHLVPCDFIVPINSYYHPKHQQQTLVAHAFAQSKTLLEGSASDVNYKRLMGNKPSNTILLTELSAYALGNLIALYEHKVFCQAAIWDINPFDQWGVEKGKIIANEIEQYLKYNNNNLNTGFDSSTNNLVRKYHIYTKTSEKQ